MSDRTTQILENLADESLNASIQMRDFLIRLHQVAPNLVPDSDLVVSQQRVERLKAMLNSLRSLKQG
jgi:hypothetical protein